MATWAEVWGESAVVVDSAAANAARALVRKMAVKRIFEVGVLLFGLVLRIMWSGISFSGKKKRMRRLVMTRTSGTSVLLFSVITARIEENKT